MKFSTSLLLLLSTLLSTTTALLPRTSTKHIPSTPFSGPITSKFTSHTTGLDSSKLSHINATSWDWWYFDAVSLSPSSSIPPNSSLVIVFYTASALGFPFLPTSPPFTKTPSVGDITLVGINAQFPDGATKTVYLNASESVVRTNGNGGSGDFRGTGAGWIGSADDESWEVKVDNAEMGVYGTFKMESRAPPHYPCGPAVRGENMMVGPNIGWSNAVPDATATVDFNFNGTKLAFTGAGYHDKNWSPQPFTKNVGSWYWGHGRVGPYSLVWFDFLSTNGTEYVSAYVTLNSKVLVSSCSPKSITVRPFGENATYPPTLESGNPSGFRILIDGTGVPGSGGKVLQFEVTTDKIAAGAKGAPYTRWVGRMSGDIGGVGLLGGEALFEGV